MSTLTLFNKSIRHGVRSHIPDIYCLRRYCPKPYSQGNLISCTASAIASYIKMLRSDFEPSRLFLYTCEQLKERPKKKIEDNGADAKTGCLIIATLGVCDEKYMPYIINDGGKVIGFGEPPSTEAYINALTHKFPIFEDITPNNPNKLLINIKIALVDNKPVLMGFLIFPSFANIGSDGIMSNPTKEDLKTFPSAHEVLCVGYNNETKYLTILNSWGEEWGDKGFFYMPYSFLIAGSYHGHWYVDQLLTLGQIK